jgi:hypothetical protein
MSVVVDSRLEWYLNEQPSFEYPSNTNEAILMNQVMASNPKFWLDHENGNHTVWLSEHHRVVVSRCESKTFSIYQVERNL